MPRGGVAARLRGELGILQVGVGRHAALPIAAGQLEHTVVQAVEAGQGHELELVAHGTDLALEPGDVVLAEVGRPVERRRAVAIGSASCRERVCQYEDISVVHGYLKKKKTQNQ